MDSVSPASGVGQSLIAGELLRLRWFREEAFRCLGRRRDALCCQGDGELRASLGENEPSRFANEERGAEAVFQETNLITHRRLRDRQFLRGTREIHVPRCGFEGTQAADGRQRLGHKADLSVKRLSSGRRAGRGQAWASADARSLHVRR